MIYSNPCRLATLSCWLILSSLPCAALASSTPLRISDLIKPPAGITVGGEYYSEPKKSFTLEVSADRFIKTYDDGVTILGMKDAQAPTYYFLNEHKKTLLKISQGNLYKIGQFFNWNTMTELVDLPAGAELTRHAGKNDDCACYGVAGSDTELCIDESRQMMCTLSEKGKLLARVTSFKPPAHDLKERIEAVIDSCRRRHYQLIDVDSDLAPDAD